MKKRILSISLILLLALSLALSAYAAEDISGRYNAVSCVQEGASFVCDGEYLLLDADGSGELCFNAEVYTISWSLGDDGGFHFVDSDGYEFLDGVWNDGYISGVFAGYTYVYESDPSAASAPVEREPASEPADVAGAVSYFASNGEYLVLNADGGGMVVYEGCAYTLTWSADGDGLTFTDNMQNTFTGSLSDGVLSGSFHGRDYTYTADGSDAPVMALSPATWGAGLGFVTDEADILTDSEEAALASRAEEISSRYGCNVYIVTLGDMRDFSLSYSVETTAEEIRCGYALGYGDGHDCVMLLLSMAERDYDLCAFGDFANSTFTDYAKDVMEDGFLDDFGNNDWYGGFDDYLDGCASQLGYAADYESDYSDDDYSGDYSGGYYGYFYFNAPFLAMTLIVAFIISLIVCLILKRRMKSVRNKGDANSYIEDSGTEISYRYDQYTHTTESRVYSPEEKSDGGTSMSSSGHSHSSGKF